MNDGADTTTSEDRVSRFQQIGFGAGEVEKGGDGAENYFGGNIGQPWTEISGVL